ncbi:hypothetical protein ACQR1W_30070 [Bradyrhizobium sp. HKCCYLS1011]|uniref:hypothetical protein n=1 Tax=Bradyrhizobium sp. HKCCYLS1011 TaxID=3420733 RepID=UPI003EB7FF57
MQLSATRLAIAVAVLVSATSSSARAEEPRSLPPVTVDAPPASPLLPSPSNTGTPTSTPSVPGGAQAGSGGGDKGRCADAKGEADTSFGCINERLKRKVDEVNPVYNTPPIDAKSSDLKVGTVNIPAVQQQYGRNFGHSVVPYRPTVIYPSGMGRH